MGWYLFLGMLVVLGNGDQGVLVDRVIAVVGEEVLTESELQIEARVALAFREGGAVATTSLEPDLLSSLRDYVVNQLVVMIHARRLGALEVSEAKADELMGTFRGKFTSYVAYQAFLRRYGITEGTVRRILLRDFRNGIFVDSRLRASGEKRKVTTDAARSKAWDLWLEQMKRSVSIRLLGENQRLEVQ